MSCIIHGDRHFVASDADPHFQIAGRNITLRGQIATCSVLDLKTGNIREKAKPLNWTEIDNPRCHSSAAGIADILGPVDCREYPGIYSRHHGAECEPAPQGQAPAQTE